MTIPRHPIVVLRAAVRGNDILVVIVAGDLGPLNPTEGERNQMTTTTIQVVVVEVGVTRDLETERKILLVGVAPLIVKSTTVIMLFLILEINRRTYHMFVLQLC